MPHPSWLVIASVAVGIAAGSSVSTSALEKKAELNGEHAGKLEKPDAKLRAKNRAPAILKVGPGEEYQRPSDVAKIVRSGDTVLIAPGTYVDCAIWPKRVDGLTIEGKDVIIADRSCADKGLFVVAASNVTIRGITFKGAKVKDHNGAGIRAQGRNLTVENSRFLDNENGILGNGAESTIIIRNSQFHGNGVCAELCAHGIYVTRIALLHIENSEFDGQHAGHHVKSRAINTELINNDIHDGPNGDASYLIDIPNAGKVLIRGNKLEKGPRSENRSAAILIGEGKDLNPAGEILIENNSFINDMATPTLFVHNLSPNPAVLKGNKLGARVKPLEGPGESK
jgi:hypothetical protein